uniref:Uncharacterized protein n=1 Tax=Octopus bimaculoides TaxID=37653 RepID=A0A0L8I2K4_OCTBM
MKAKCPQKHKEEVTKKEQQGEEGVQDIEKQRPVENMEETSEKRMSRKEMRYRKNQMRKTQRENRDRYQQGGESKRAEKRDDRGEMSAVSNERHGEREELEIPVTTEEFDDGKQREELKGKHIRTLIQQRKM